ncbi:MAG: asparagine synthase (glutamine-hydrolyzing) [Candidimonas sp.]|nr:MAG: asparagine synthase (glutamine-hydrolyzing) [Candidimonas sp.]
MCGIVGIWGALPDRRAVVDSSCAKIRHRGPDARGYWEDAAADLAFGHARLAIQDLSAAGDQPMVSACGRYTLVFNGEIYNHLELRDQLRVEGRAPIWRGHSDTETLLACLARWGVATTLERAVGMFALGLWDREARSLTLARDRMGEKPLYFGFAGPRLVFASEVKALVDVPGFDRALEPRALSLLLRHNYIPAPWCIYRALRKLMPGTFMTVTGEHLRRRDLPEPVPYWSARAVAREAARHRLVFDSDEQAVDALEQVLRASVAGQMLADVPLGAFLSGGIDSSLVVALMQARASRPVRTFSIGFHDPAHDEAAYAREVAGHLKTEHTELYVSARDLLDVVPRLPSLYDEPFADSSQIPTVLVARMARQHVTVALSGDGGDELFGGYARYFRAQRRWRHCTLLPAAARGMAGVFGQTAARALPDGRWRDRVARAAGMFGAPHAGRFYRSLVSYWEDPARALIAAEEPGTVFDEPSSAALLDQMMLLDTVTYLPDDILVKVDRAAMAVGLETRVPLIDHRVFEFAQRLPLRYKVRGGRGKVLPRQLLCRYVPAAMVDRPKKGFSVPLGQWLRGPLKDWGAALLDPQGLRDEGIFQPRPILRKWREHQSGQHDWSTHLWSVLMVRAWLDEARHGRGGEVA